METNNFPLIITDDTIPDEHTAWKNGWFKWREFNFIKTGSNGFSKKQVHFEYRVNSDYYQALVDIITERINSPLP